MDIKEKVLKEKYGDNLKNPDFIYDKQGAEELIDLTLAEVGKVIDDVEFEIPKDLHPNQVKAILRFIKKFKQKLGIK